MRRGIAWLWVVCCGLWAARTEQARSFGLRLTACAALSVVTAIAPAAANPQPKTHNSATVPQASVQPAAGLLPTIAARVQAAPVLRGEFAQQRTLAGFAKPLRSSGSFVAARGKGVLWTTSEPFPGELVITANAIRERVEGEESVVVDASREPALREVNRILMALLQGDLASLSTQFDVAGEDSGSGWRLQLLPRGELAQAIARIELSGSSQVQRVAIHEPAGDISVIEFSAQAGTDALAPAEAARFD